MMLTSNRKIIANFHFFHQNNRILLRHVHPASSTILLFLFHTTLCYRKTRCCIVRKVQNSCRGNRCIGRTFPLPSLLHNFEWCSSDHRRYLYTRCIILPAMFFRNGQIHCRRGCIRCNSQILPFSFRQADSVLRGGSLPLRYSIHSKNRSSRRIFFPWSYVSDLQYLYHS